MLIEYEKHFLIMQNLYNYANKTSISEVPVSSIIVLQNKIISIGNNKMIKNNNPNDHAEILALKKASYKLKTHFLHNSTIYITQEPCVMCIESIMNHKIKKIIFGSESLSIKKWDLFKHLIYRKKLDIVINIKDVKCKKVIKNFFLKYRYLRR
jgi:tRNA(adenine34) deaminase